MGRSQCLQGDGPSLFACGDSSIDGKNNDGHIAENANFIIGDDFSSVSRIPPKLTPGK